MARLGKSEMLLHFLAERGVHVPRGRLGWTKVSCYGPSHAHGDKNPSASVNLSKGRYNCFACELAGDVYDLLQAEAGIGFKEAKQQLGGEEKRHEPTWI